MASGHLDAGVVRPTIEDFTVAVLLDHIAAGYATVAETKGLALRMAPCPPHVRSDRVLLGRLIRNLVENAVRYTHRGSVEINCQVVAEHLRIDVTDTGIGIPQDHLGQIFEEFHQVGNSERDRGQGLCLGLAIVRGIGRLLDLSVTVRSESGRGSVFSVEVPLAEVPLPHGQTLADHSPGPTGHERFAVVID